MSFVKIKLLILNLMIINIFAAKKDAPIVNTILGTIKGFHKVSYKNRTYDAFTGIPYAEPPVGDYRFQAPKPIKKWNGPLDATKEPSKCPQWSQREKKAVGDEDCLFLNVYRPHNVKNNSLLPVIFYIHGGAFLIGSSNEYEPKYMMDKDIVFVSTNYRLNAFGFFSTGDDVVSGNMGLKDQSLALQWTVKNIENFGGDPKKITLYGCSAGGASVHHQYLSPLSKDLFINGISQSGSALAPWAFTNQPRKNAKKIAKMLGCPKKNSTALVDCMKKLSISKLAVLSENFAAAYERPPFRPVAETIKDGYFINDTPENIITRGEAIDVPWIAGTTTEEGIMFTFGFLLNQTTLTYIDEDWKKMGPYLMFMQDDKSKERRLKSARLSRKHYLKKKSLNVTDYKTLKNLIHLSGDKGIVFPTGKAAVLQAKANKNPVYLYQYSFRAEHGLGDDLLRGAKVDFGVCHCDDADLILKNPMAAAPTRKNDLQMQQIMIDMIYSLATTGKPDVGVEWPQIKPTNKSAQYLHIAGPNEMVVKSAKNYGEKVFWNKLGF